MILDILVYLILLDTEVSQTLPVLTSSRKPATYGFPLKSVMSLLVM